MITDELAHKMAGYYHLPWHDKEDLEQELAMLGLQLERLCMPVPYIKAAMRNRAIDILRHRSREAKRLMPLDYAQGLAQKETQYLSEIWQLQKEKERLDKWQRKILNLIGMGNSVVETAGLTGFGEKRIFRLLKKLRDNLS